MVQFLVTDLPRDAHWWCSSIWGVGSGIAHKGKVE